MERYITVSFCGAECRSFENKISALDGDTMTIDLGDTIGDTAIIIVVRWDKDAEDYRERKITMADLRSYLEQRDAYVAASTTSRLGQSAQIEEVK
jgi:hypothetical protein